MRTRITQQHTHHPGIYNPHQAFLYDASRASVIAQFRAGGAGDEWAKDEPKIAQTLPQVKLLEREITELGQHLVENYAPSFADAPMKWLIRLDTLCMLYSRCVGGTAFLNPFVLMAISQDSKHFEAISDWKDISVGGKYMLTGFIRDDMISCKRRVGLPPDTNHMGVCLKRVLWQDLPLRLSSKKGYNTDLTLGPHLIHPDLVGGLNVSFYVGDLESKSAEGRMPKVMLSKL